MDKKKRIANTHLLFFIILPLLVISISFTWQFISPTTSRAQTYYKSINCPTPGASKSSLQMIPCTPSGAVTIPPQAPQSAAQQVSSSPSSSPASSSNNPVSGPVCTPDSKIANGAACKCQSDLEPDALCTVPNAQTCQKNGGLLNPLAFAGLGGSFNAGQLNKSVTQNGTGPVQCMWLDTAPVPAAAQATNCSIECNSKPVLYFYSPTTLSISVSLDIPGVITASIPQYPAKGWQNVIVHPQGTTDGTLYYNNKSLNELYYEDATIKAQPPTEGFVIKTTDLTTSLRTYTAKLGLNANEQNEFIAYWVPRLTNLNAPYIFFTVFDKTQKEKVDHVIVSPKPTTTIAFLAYFKPLTSPIKVSPLHLAPVPKRQGFTMVEWGGTIENN
ncbi:MAG TPA: hypothetical protein VND99_03650 [Candidatus Acidoferrales bacterium]|nr:hypothetical protein [Candidatus Acidoferrales bacterium]